MKLIVKAGWRRSHWRHRLRRARLLSQHISWRLHYITTSEEYVTNGQILFTCFEFILSAAAAENFVLIHCYLTEFWMKEKGCSFIWTPCIYESNATLTDGTVDELMLHDVSGKSVTSLNVGLDDLFQASLSRHWMLVWMICFRQVCHIIECWSGWSVSGKSGTSLNVGLDDLLRADCRGKWYLVGSAWHGRDDSTKSETANSG